VAYFLGHPVVIAFETIIISLGSLMVETECLTRPLHWLVWA